MSSPEGGADDGPAADLIGCQHGLESGSCVIAAAQPLRRIGTQRGQRASSSNAFDGARNGLLAN